MGNRKGISSEELFGNQYEKSEEVKAKYSSLAGARAISSDMFFGNGESQSSNEGISGEKQSDFGKISRFNINPGLGMAN